MQITLKNNQPGTRTYLGGVVTISEGASVQLSRDLNVVITQDTQFLLDIQSNTIIFNDGSTDYDGSSATTVIKFLAQFLTDPIATVFLYYGLPVALRQSAATASGSTVWSVRNPQASPYAMLIESIDLTVSFDAGTPLIARSLQYDLLRFNTATPTAGTQLSAVRADTNALAFSADARFLDTGLSVTGVTFEAAFASIICPAVQGSVVSFRKKLTGIKLAAGEGLAIQLGQTAVVGQNISGHIAWSLR